MRSTLLTRPIWIAAGLVAVACAVVGAVLPLVPTTPFLLLAAYAFARSSPRLHRWLTTHKQFGPLIDDWNRHGAVSRRTKTISVSIIVAMPFATWMLGAPSWVIVTQAAVLACVATFILSRPAPPRAGPSQP